jgi:hypothetical protein
MTPQTAYILGEVQHLRFCGARWDYICEALKTNPIALAKLAYRHNKPELAPPIPYKRKEK